MVKLIAVFQNKLKNSYITFTQEDAKSEVIVNGNIKQLKKGKHGFHIHEKGNLTKSDCSKCEGHWNPKKSNMVVEMIKIVMPGILVILRQMNKTKVNFILQQIK